jgi:hypothetical protein
VNPIGEVNPVGSERCAASKVARLDEIDKEGRAVRLGEKDGPEVGHVRQVSQISDQSNRGAAERRGR